MALNNIFEIAGSGMSAQTIRLNTTASNIANAESASSSSGETYRARYPVFSAVMSEANFGFENELQSKAGSVAVAAIVESDKPLQQRFEPDNPMANEDGVVFYPNVNIVEEMTNMISASRSFQANVDVMNTSKTMMQRILTLGQ